MAPYRPRRECTGRQFAVPLSDLDHTRDAAGTYIGIGVGVERARLFDYETNHQETAYAPAIQELVNMKIFLIKNVVLLAGGNRQPLGTHSTTMKRCCRSDIMNGGPSHQTT